MARPHAFVLAVALTQALVMCTDGPAPTRTAVAADECYTLTYDDGDRADTLFFPRALGLGAGTDSGTVSAGTDAAAGAVFWSLFGADAAWRRLPSDSLQVTLSNGVSATDLVVAHDGSRLAGRAEFRFQPEAEPYPVLGVRGRRSDCSAARP
jgi:hypothetical protein